MNRYPMLLAGLAALCLATACQPAANNDVPPAETSSFDRMQDVILTKSCAFPGCHASEKDGLVLTKGLAYDRLVNAAPKNANALKDGLKQVTPFNADKSLLYHKLHGNADGHHTSDYGKQMPLGAPPISASKIEFIRRWIAAGAPRTGDIVDVKLLN
jgi:hypothetical protein